MAESDEDLERRIAAVERAVEGTAADADPDDTEELESRVATLESRVDELDAAVQAVRGFLGGVSAVNEAVERRADAAVAAVERLESRLDGSEEVDTLDEGGDAFGERGKGDSFDDGEGLSVSFDETENETTNGEPDERDAPSEQGLRERLRDLR